MSPNSTAASAVAPAVAPVPGRAAAVILGSMVVMILALTAILVQTTWVDPVVASEPPVVIGPGGVAGE